MSSIRVGAHAPHVSLLDSKLAETEIPKHGEVTVLAFFPAAFTDICTAELCTFRDSMADFNGMHAKVYGISVDSPFALDAFKTQNRLEFPLLSDHKHKAIESYGVVFENLAFKGIRSANRAVFVIGKDGNVAWSWVGEHPGMQPPFEDVKKAVQAASRA